MVKADGYGHGAVPVARAALDAGATWLGVALVEEGVALREAGIDAPILVLSEPSPDAAAAVVAHRLTPVVYTPAGIDALAKAVADVGAAEPLAVHLKVDTGMHRVGCRPTTPSRSPGGSRTAPSSSSAGVLHPPRRRRRARRPVHAPSSSARFDAVLADLEAAGPAPADRARGQLRRACSRSRDARFDLVRVGIAVYGIPPVARARRVASRCGRRSRSRRGSRT